MKIAMLFPYAPAYREAIYRIIDNALDVEWFFCGDAKQPLKILDYSILRITHLELSEATVYGNIRYIRNFNPALFEKFDTIILPGDIRNLSYWKLLFYRKWQTRRPQIIFWTHGWYGRESKIQSCLKRFYHRKVDKFLLYGEYAKSIMEKEGFSPAKLFVVANSLDYDKQLRLRNQLRPSNIIKNRFKNDNPTIIFIGRLTHEKRLDMLLDAVHNLRTKSFYLNVLLVGDGEEKDLLSKYAEQKGLSDLVWFYGACYDERTNAELIYNSDLCVSPGNVGLTAIHSLMFGCPLITHDDFAHQGPEFEAITKGETGDFFRKDSVQSLAETIQKWFKDFNNDRNTIRIKCFNEIDNHWNPHIQLAVIEEAIKS